MKKQAPSPAPVQPENKFSAGQRKAMGAVVAATNAADAANRQRTSSYGELATKVEALLGKAGDAQTARLLTATYAALVPTIGGKDKDADKDAAAIWLRRAQILGVTVRRFVDGKAGSAPRFNLLYISLDRKACAATVVCLAKPTAAEVKLALASDTKACNAQLAKLFPPKPVKADGKPTPQPTPGALPGKVNKGDAMGALRELVTGWRPAELEAAAAFLLDSAAKGREAIAASKAAKAGKAPAKVA